MKRKAGEPMAEGPSGAAAPDAELSRAETLRYVRHLVLDDIGEAGQARLKAARVLIVGVGGLGSPAALYLAAAGVGTLGLVDFDVVDATNLQRQVLFGESDLGRAKLDAAAERLRDLNPHVRVVRHPERLTSENALDVIRDYDIVVDATDNFPTRYLVNDACVLLGKRYVYGSILKFEGQVSVFGGDDAPCYRCLFRQPPPPGLVPSCADAGVLGALPGVIGSLQALETVKLITGAGEPLIGRLLLFDGLKLKWRDLTLRRNPDCPACGDHPTVTGLIDYERFCATEGASISADALEPDPAGQADDAEIGEAATPFEIEPARLKERLDRGDPIDLVDVREPFEWRIANLGEYGARLIPAREIESRLHEIDPDRETVFICRVGERSGDVARLLRKRGYNTRNLRGGLVAWHDDVDPGMPRY